MLKETILASLAGDFGAYAVSVLCDWYKESREARDSDPTRKEGVLADYLDEIADDSAALAVFIVDNVFSGRGRAEIAQRFLNGDLKAKLPSQLYYRWVGTRPDFLRGT